MSMRVSTAQIFSGGTAGIQNVQSDLYNLQNQVSTGRRILTPKDDPVGSAQALVVTQSQAVNQLYVKNQQAASSKLSALDATLGGVNDELQYIRSKMVAAGNGTFSDAERQATATELEARLSSLLGLANTQDGTGRYVFAGFQSTTTPFAVTANVSPFSLGNPTIGYSGDDGVQTLQVGASQNMATNAPGSEVFMRIKDSSGNVTGRSVFDSVQNMIDLLRTPGSNATAPAYSQALNDMSAAIDNVSRVRTDAGTNLSSLDSLGSMAGDRDLQYQTQLSGLQDLDYAKAISDVSQKKLQLEAAQSTFAITSKLSLFDHI